MKSLLILLFFFNIASASTYYVEISMDSGAPPISQIVQQGSVSPSPPTFSLQAFNSIRPINIKYLIDDRATGNLREVMDTHPLWSMSRLQQYVVVIYDDNINTQNIETSLSSDLFIKSFNAISVIDNPLISTFQGINKFRNINNINRKKI